MIFDLNQNAPSFRHQLSRHDEGKLFLGRIRGSLFWHVAATNVIYTIPFFITRSDVFFFTRVIQQQWKTQKTIPSEKYSSLINVPIILSLFYYILAIFYMS